MTKWRACEFTYERRISSVDISSPQKPRCSPEVPSFLLAGSFSQAGNSATAKPLLCFSFLRYCCIDLAHFLSYVDEEGCLVSAVLP